MSLYDDIDTEKAQGASGWSSGVRLMHNQLAFKKATMTVPKRDPARRPSGAKLLPVIDLKSRRDEDESMSQNHSIYPNVRPEKTENTRTQNGSSGFINSNDPEWKFNNEYDPMWPNDYEKFVRDMRERRDREEDVKRSKEREDRDVKRKSRIEETGFSRRRESEEEEEEEERPRRGVGVAIAPPASLDPSTEQITQIPTSSNPRATFGGMGGSIAAKIMARYGFREGQGLGKSKQGIVRALEVEKTSKRGGRIVLEEEAPSPPHSSQYQHLQQQHFRPLSPPLNSPQNVSNAEPQVMSPPVSTPPKPAQQDQHEKKIADILRNPSKVALLRNMVGPGEVDDELEPEVREECTTKYGQVVQCVIFEIPRAPPDEGVRIFVEFARVESAIKAVIDLNGRFFGGRQVKAGFYNIEDFKNYKLNEIVL